MRKNDLHYTWLGVKSVRVAYLERNLSSSMSCSHVAIGSAWAARGLLAITTTGLMVLGFWGGILGARDGSSRDGFSGAATPAFPPPQNTLVTRSMTLPPLDEWCLLPLSPKPLIRLDSSAEARSTTPWAEMDDILLWRGVATIIRDRSWLCYH